MNKNLNNWKLDLFKGTDGYEIFKEYLQKSSEMYFHQKIRLTVSRILLHNKWNEYLKRNKDNQEWEIIPEQLFSITDFKESLAEYKYSQKIGEFQDNYMPITIIHSLKHAYMQKDEGADVYIHTGGGSTLIQGGEGASHLYYSKDEVKWGKLSRYWHKEYKEAWPTEDIVGMDEDLGISLDELGELIAGSGTILGKRIESWPIAEGDILQTTEQSWNNGIKIMDWLENKSPNKEKYKELFSKSNPGPLFSYLKKITSAGYKGPSGKGKGNDYGVSMELVFPENVRTPMWKIIYNKPEKLIPRRYKKVRQTQINELSVPQNEDMLKITTSRAIELKNLSERTEEKQLINRFFEDTWKNLVRIKPNAKVDIMQFQRFMIETIPKDLNLSFEDWFYEKFQDAIDKKDKKYISDYENLDFFLTPSEISSEISRTYDSMEERFEDIISRGSIDAKEVGINHLLYIASLDKMISEPNLRKIGRLAFKHDFEPWKKIVLPNYLGVSAHQIGEIDRSLHKWYGTLISSVKTNGKIRLVNGKPVAALNQRNNWWVEKMYTWDESTDSFRYSGAAANLVGHERPDGTQNIPYDKGTIYELNAPTGKKYIFSVLGGSNVLTMQNDFDFKGNQIYTTNPITGRQIKKKSLKPAYGFISPNELMNVEKAFRERDKTIAFIRGDSSRMMLVDITEEHKNEAKNPKAYWDKQKYVLPEQIPDLVHEDFIVENYGEEKDKFNGIASMIAIHEAMQHVWPKYLLDPKGGANVYKRLKLPFTPGTYSRSMPPVRVVRFNPDDVMFQFEDGEPFSPVQYIFGEPTYILDGNTLTSKSLFDLYLEHFGLAPRTSKAKTVMYEKRGDNILAIKHSHVAPRKGLRILNKDGGELFIVDKHRNILLGKAHPSYVEGGNNAVHFLATNDEIKIREIFDFEGDVIDISGQSIVFTKFDEDAKNETKHPPQWYNYVTDDAVLEHFRDVIVPEIHRKISSAIYLTLNHHDKDGKLTRSAADSMLKFLEKSKGKNPLGYLPTALEHAKLGAGIHKSNNVLMDKLAQTLIVNDALNLAGKDGSILDIAIDATNTVGRREVHLAKQNSKAIIERVRNITGKKLKIDDINTWLKDNKIYVYISRTPITNKGGAYMARVTRLHNRKSLADLNPFDVKEYLEADGDGDEIHMELLSEAATPIFKNFLDNIDFIPYSLNDFVTGRKYSITSTEKRFETMSSLITGQTAIGEIASLMGVYSIIQHKFKSISLQDKNGFMVKVKIPNPSDTINFHQATYKGKKGSWNGTVEDYLRIWLQAAADNNEYGLLFEWGYNETGAKGIMYDLLGKPDEKWFEVFWDEIYDHYKEVRTVRKAEDFKKGKLSFKDILNKSNKIKEHNDKLMNNDNKVFEENTDRTTLHPFEYIAMAPIEVWQRIKNNFEVTGYEDGSPFILSKNVHDNAHNDAVKFIKANLGTIIERKFNQDKKLGNVPSDVVTWRNEQQILGNDYVIEMANAFYKVLKEVGELGPQSMDRNDKLIDFKIKYNDKFKELSNLAKTVATYKFITGYSTFSSKVGEGTGSAHPVALPPISKSKKEYSLLDAGIMSIFFKQYNKIATSPEMKKRYKDKKITGRVTDNILNDYVKRICN